MNYLTAGLAIATGWLAIETRRMAGAAKAQVDLQSQPFLSFRGVDVVAANTANISNAQTLPALGFHLRLGNPGQVLVTYKVEELNSSLGNHSLNSGAFVTFGGVIHPHEETLFILPFTQQTSSNVLPKAEIDFKIDYWAVAGKKQRLSAKIEIQIISINPLNLQWVYLDGPTYA